MRIAPGVRGGGRRGRPRARLRARLRDRGRAPAVFDDFADRYARFNELRDRLLPAIPEWLRAHAPGGGRAIDLGCGDGLHAVRLGERYDQVLAVDISEAMLRLARTHHPRGNVRYQRRGVLDVTPERDGLFDAVVSINCLHHVGPLDVVFSHVRSLLAPGALVAIADIVDPGGWGDRDWHINQAIAGARSFYDLAGGDPDVAADTLRLLLHPRWLDMTTTDLPPTRDQFHRHAGVAFPGAGFNDDIHPVMCAVTWQAPS
jgi:SAM-dependent methyltransferase